MILSEKGALNDSRAEGVVHLARDPLYMSDTIIAYTSGHLVIIKVRCPKALYVGIGGYNICQLYMKD